jgi:hypothetical protein
MDPMQGAEIGADARARLALRFLWVTVPSLVGVIALGILFVFPPRPPITRSMQAVSLVSEVEEPVSAKPVSLEPSEPSGPSETSETSERSEKADVQGQPVSGGSTGSALKGLPAPSSGRALNVSVTRMDVDYLKYPNKATQVLREYELDVRECLARVAVTTDVEGEVVLDFEPVWSGKVPRSIAPSISKSLPQSVRQCFLENLPSDLGSETEINQDARVRMTLSVSTKLQ